MTGINNAGPYLGSLQTTTSAETGESKALTQASTSAHAQPGSIREGDSSSHNTSLITNANGAPSLVPCRQDVSYEQLADVVSKTTASTLNSAQQNLERESTKRSDISKQQAAKSAEWQKKAGSSTAKTKAMGILGWVKKIVVVAAAAFAVAVTIVATVASGGAAAPLLALATLALISASAGLISDIAKANGRNGFDEVVAWIDPGTAVGKVSSIIAKSLGASEETASKIETGFAIATTVAILAATIVVTFGTGAASAPGAIAKIIEQGAQTGLILAGIAGGAVQTVEGGLNIAVAHDRRDIAVIESAQKQLKATMLHVQQHINDFHEDLKKLLNELMECISLVSDMVRANGENHLQIAKNLSGKGQAI